jgi:hypothetical protein
LYSTCYVGRGSIDTEPMCTCADEDEDDLPLEIVARIRGRETLQSTEGAIIVVPERQWLV